MSQPGDDLRFYTQCLGRRLGGAAQLLWAIKPLRPRILRWALKHRL